MENLIRLPFTGTYYTHWDTYPINRDFTGFARAYVAAMDEKIEWDLDINLQLSFASVFRPREYNFGTDEITAKIENPAAIPKLWELAQDFLPEVLAEYCTSRDGFISFYSNDPEELREKWRRGAEFDAIELWLVLIAAIRGAGFASEDEFDPFEFLTDWADVYDDDGNVLTGNDEGAQNEH